MSEPRRTVRDLFPDGELRHADFHVAARSFRAPIGDRKFRTHTRLSPNARAIGDG